MLTGDERYLQKAVARDEEEKSISRSQNRTAAEDKEIRASFTIKNLTASQQHTANGVDGDEEEGHEVPQSATPKQGYYSLVHHTANDADTNEVESKETVDPTTTTAYYLQHNLINLNDPDAILKATSNFKDLPAAQQTQLMDHFKMMITLHKSNKHATPLSNFLNYADPRINNKKKNPIAPWNALPKEFKEELANYYIQTYKLQYYLYCIQGIGGYGSEFLYLAWDQVARIRITRKMTGMPDEYNYAINYTVLPFVAQSQLTYNPLGEANDYMINRMVYQKSLTSVILANKLKTLAFFLYAFGGGYVEVVDINDGLEEEMGGYKWPVIISVLWFAIVYYAMMQFMDVINKFEAYSEQPSLLKRALNPFNGEKVSDRITDLFCAQHEFMCWIERIFRMAYGGFEAGLQQGGDIAAYIVGGAVGLGTAPVAYAIRTMPIRNIYDLKRFEEPVEILETDGEEEIAAKRLESRKPIENAIEKYNLQYAQNRLKGEIKLFLTPTIAWLAPAAFFAAQYGTTGIKNPYYKVVTGIAIALGTTIVLHAGLGLRYPAKRRAIVSIAEEAATPNKDVVKPSTLAYAIAKPSNFLDQTSRCVTFVYGVGEMAPSLFDLSTKLGQDMFWSVLAESAFISLSAYIYQYDKNARALASMWPRFFAKKVGVTQARLSAPLLGGDDHPDSAHVDHADMSLDVEGGPTSSSESDILIGIANDPQSNEQHEEPRSRFGFGSCAIM